MVQPFTRCRRKRLASNPGRWRKRRGPGLTRTICGLKGRFSGRSGIISQRRPAGYCGVTTVVVVVGGATGWVTVVVRWMVVVVDGGGVVL